MSGDVVELVHTIRGGTIRRLRISDAELHLYVSASAGSVMSEWAIRCRLRAAGFTTEHELVSYHDMLEGGMIFEQCVVPAPRPTRPEGVIVKFPGRLRHSDASRLIWAASIFAGALLGFYANRAFEAARALGLLP